MSINKILPIAICCLVVVLWSDSQCMENQTDILESLTVNRTTSMQSHSKNEIADLSLEDKASWASYLLYPAKTVIHSAYEVIKYTTQNPKNAMIIGVVLASQLTAVAASCDCLCYVNKCTDDVKYPEYFGLHNSTESCLKLCIAARLGVGKCVPR